MVQRPPIRRFVYHALHKTGSVNTRNQLRIFCKVEQLNCLTYCACGLCKYSGGPIGCHKKLSRLFNVDGNVDLGSLTVKRMRTGCCPAYARLLLDKEERLDGVVEHLPLNLPENREFLEHKIGEDAFRFTIVRDPTEQFVSYWRMLRNAKYEKFLVPSLNETIELFWRVRRNEKSELSENQKQLRALLENSQSKELGWDGKSRESLNETLEYVRTLAFVGITSRIKEGWTILRKMLRWSPRLFVDDRPKLSRAENREIGNLYASKLDHGESKRDVAGLSPSQRTKIAEFQWADRLLYNLALSIFDRLMKKLDE